MIENRRYSPSNYTVPAPTIIKETPNSISSPSSSSSSSSVCSPPSLTYQHQQQPYGNYVQHHQQQLDQKPVVIQQGVITPAAVNTTTGYPSSNAYPGAMDQYQASYCITSQKNPPNYGSAFPWIQAYAGIYNTFWNLYKSLF